MIGNNLCIDVRYTGPIHKRAENKKQTVATTSI